MIALTLERRIAAPPSRVFAALTDLERLPERLPAVSVVQILTPGATGLGTRWAETRVWARRRETQVMTFTAFDPPRGYVAAARAHGADYETRVTLEPEDAGGGAAATRLTLVFGATPRSLFARSFARIAPMLGSALTGPARRAIAADLDAIAAVCEADPIGAA